jgi:hypothetical protein
MNPFDSFVQGIGFWSPHWSDWGSAASGWNQHTASIPTTNTPFPSPRCLSPADRRRAAQTVCLALEVGQQALANSDQHADQVLSVFTSAHGDLPNIHAMCSTLVDHPELVSPLRFLNSIHNAAAGYWSQAMGSMSAHTALSAHRCSFAAGLLEALSQCEAEGQPVLLVGYDTAAIGPLRDTTGSEWPLALALLLTPHRTRRSKFRLTWKLDHTPAEQGNLLPAGESQTGMADGLPLFERLARPDRTPVKLLLPPSHWLEIGVEALAPEP